MNIKQAKRFISETVRLYLKKDEYGEYRIPVKQQRPIFLLGAPGVGKTAIMEQIASELSIALVSYSMTHHTRQSALGLPFITEKEYDGNKYQVSEYTMSEIIASVYDTMEKSGIKEGILFLDEINCVSETLSPSMLQFLQYKVFGRHSVPEGWVVVTAGNPPEYNKSVRDFDVVTMDRLKLLEVVPNYACWKEYAQEANLHSSIMSFLDLKKDYFYKIETVAKGRSYVTARGWEDLSKILYLYEEEGLECNEELIGQYLRNDRIVREFAAYLELYNRYKRDYAIDAILDGEPTELALVKASKAAFDERLSLVSMLLDRVMSEMKSIMEKTEVLNDLLPLLKQLKLKAELKEQKEYIEKQLAAHEELENSLKAAGALSAAERKKQKAVTAFLRQVLKTILENNEAEQAFEAVKGAFDKKVTHVKNLTAIARTHLKGMFDFAEQAFGDGNEMLIIVSALTAGRQSALFLARFPSAEYNKYSAQLQVADEMSEIAGEIDELFGDVNV